MNKIRKGDQVIVLTGFFAASSKRALPLDLGVPSS